MDREQLAGLECPVEAAMNVLGGKYKVLICFQLVGRTLRYSELARRVPKASPKMLSQQLKELEADGVVHREMYPQVPPRTEYSLTELGEALAPTILAMWRWGAGLFDREGLERPCSEASIARVTEVAERQEAVDQA